MRPCMSSHKPPLPVLSNPLNRDVAIWSVMEPSIGIIAGCTATLRPLFKSWGFGWSSGKNSENDAPGGGYRGSRKSGFGTLEQKNMGGSRNRVEDEESSGGSEIELYNAHAQASAAWDLERVAFPVPPKTGVRVKTSIRVSSAPHRSSSRSSRPSSAGSASLGAQTLPRQPPPASVI